MKREVDKEVFNGAMRAMVVELVRIVSTAMERNVAPPPPPEFIPNFLGTLWDVTRPDVQCWCFDLSDKVDDVPDADKYGGDIRYWVFTNDNGLLMTYVEGSTNADLAGYFAATPAFDEGITTVCFKLLTEEVGVSAEDAHEALHEGSVGARTKRFLDDLLQERIEAEVESFRDEINSKLDTMFGGGDST